MSLPQELYIICQKSQCWAWKIFFQVVDQGKSRDSQTMWAIAIALGCRPELEGMFLLCKIPNTLDIGLGGIDLVLTWKPPPGGLGLIEAEGCT